MYTHTKSRRTPDGVARLADLVDARDHGLGCGGVRAAGNVRLHLNLGFWVVVTVLNGGGGGGGGGE